MLGLSAKEKEAKLVAHKISKMTEDFVRAVRALQQTVEEKERPFGVIVIAQVDERSDLHCGDASKKFTMRSLDRLVKERL